MAYVIPHLRYTQQSTDRADVKKYGTSCNSELVQEILNDIEEMHKGYENETYSGSFQGNSEELSNEEYNKSIEEITIDENIVIKEEIPDVEEIQTPTTMEIDDQTKIEDIIEVNTSKKRKKKYLPLSEKHYDIKEIMLPNFSESDQSEDEQKKNAIQIRISEPKTFKITKMPIRIEEINNISAIVDANVISDDNSNLSGDINIADSRIRNNTLLNPQPGTSRSFANIGKSKTNLSEPSLERFKELIMKQSNTFPQKSYTIDNTNTENSSQNIIAPVKNDLLDLFFSSIAATVKQFSPYLQHMAKTKIFQTVSELEIQHVMQQQRQVQRQNLSKK